jgi:hypothetical protein
MLANAFGFGSTTLRAGGHLIKTAAGMSGGFTRSTANRSARVTGPEANSIGDDVDTVTSSGHRGPGERCEREPGPPNGARKPLSADHARYV